jgi:hypothetical protein
MNLSCGIEISLIYYSASMHYKVSALVQHPQVPMGQCFAKVATHRIENGIHSLDRGEVTEILLSNQHGAELC